MTTLELLKKLETERDNHLARAKLANNDAERHVYEQQAAAFDRVISCTRSVIKAEELLRKSRTLMARHAVRAIWAGTEI